MAIPVRILTLEGSFVSNLIEISKTPSGGCKDPLSRGGGDDDLEFLAMSVDSYIRKDHMCQI